MQGTLRNAWKLGCEPARSALGGDPKALRGDKQLRLEIAGRVDALREAHRS